MTVAQSSTEKMNCVLEGNCVKAFGKAIQALSRIGDELWLDPMVKGLALRSVNSAQSAYACFLFTPLFFQHYSLGSGPEQGSEAITCKLVMKSVLSLFRCLTSIERNVERCQISVAAPNDQVTIQFFCRHGITKTHNLRFQESEAVQALFASHLCPNVLKARARLLGDMVMHFPVSQEEITLSVTPMRVSLKNYYEGETDHKKMMYTEMSLHPDEFDYFQFGEDSDITFCLKELRGLLSFAETHFLPVSVHFSAPGKPVCFSVENMVLKATVVLSTLIDSERRPAETPVQTSPRHAAEPMGSYEADTTKPQNISTVTEIIASSQGSPIFNPTAMMPLLPQIDDPHRLVPDEAHATTPASSMVRQLCEVPKCVKSLLLTLLEVCPVWNNASLYEICSLLFRALSSEQDEDGQVLACYSDMEEDMEEQHTRSP